jgi:hypothetical protein
MKKGLTPKMAPLKKDEKTNNRQENTTQNNMKVT